MTHRQARSFSAYLSTKEAARHLNLSPRTLEAMRLTGRGPACRRHGRLWRYRVDELDQWSDLGRSVLTPADGC
ncbi:helix-turn-helix domain-containing protein [Sphingomonas oryzagri]